jgi:hypothetical protein
VVSDPESPEAKALTELADKIASILDATGVEAEA